MKSPGTELFLSVPGLYFETFPEADFNTPKDLANTFVSRC